MARHKKKRKNRKAISTCRKKVRYDKAWDARNAAKRLRMRMYRCPVCKSFHLTSNIGY
jgi:transposase-like protein